jgi:arsenate reductase (glutaredoxin)
MTANSLILYGIPNCDQVKKARNWLAARDLPYRFHDFKKSGVNAELIAAWLGQAGLETLLNRKGTTWRALPPERKAAAANEAGAAALMVEMPSLIKRPVLAIGNRIIVGFFEEHYQQILNP